MISEMLGVPVSDRADYQRWASTMLSLTVDVDQLRAAQNGIYGSLGELVKAKHQHPANDTISDLAHGKTPLTDAEVANISALLLITGLETTTYMLG